MTPISPVLTEEYQDREVVYAKDQPQYLPLPTLRNGIGVVVSRWRPTETERQAIAEGADIYLSVWTFNQPLQPVQLQTVECAADVADIARRVGLLG